MNVSHSNFINLICCLLCASALATNVVTKTPCRCESKDGNVLLDISDLGNKNNVPRFSVGTDDIREVLFYNPCYPLKFDTETRVAAYVEKGYQKDVIGLQQSALFWLKSENELAVNYIAGSGPSAKMLTVYFKCNLESKEPTFRFLNKTCGHYEVSLESKDVCKKPLLKAGSSNSDDKEGISAGSVLLIIFFVGLTVYLIGGFLFNKFVKNAQGLELIPNYDLWMGLIENIKAGIFFTFGLCTNRPTAQKPYDDI